MSRQLHVGPVIETRSPQRSIVHPESSDADDVQRHVGRGAQARNVSCVWWNLRFDKRDVEHDRERQLSNKQKETTSFA